LWIAAALVSADVSVWAFFVFFAAAASLANLFARFAYAVPPTDAIAIDFAGLDVIGDALAGKAAFEWFIAIAVGLALAFDFGDGFLCYAFAFAFAEFGEASWIIVNASFIVFALVFIMADGGAFLWIGAACTGKCGQQERGECHGTEPPEPTERSFDGLLVLGGCVLMG
jgi:hypothetical protein